MSRSAGTAAILSRFVPNLVRLPVVVMLIAKPPVGGFWNGAFQIQKALPRSPSGHCPCEHGPRVLVRIDSAEWLCIQGEIAPAGSSVSSEVLPPKVLGEDLTLMTMRKRHRSR